MCVELCIQSDLVTALVLLSKVTANTEPLPLGASGHNVLLKDILFNMYCWLIDIELTAKSAVTPAWTKLI